VGAPSPVAGRDVVVVGASAGGVEALGALAGALPPDLAAAVLVVLHLPRAGFSALPSILDRSGPLPARTAVHGEPMRHGRIYVAPADHHLLLDRDRIQLSRGPAENGLRPAVDPLFRSAARTYGPRVIGVVLSGTRDDGAAGLAAIAERGGLAMVQDPAEAVYPGMPSSSLALVPAAICAKAAALGGLIARAAEPGNSEAAWVGAAQAEAAQAEAARAAAQAEAAQAETAEAQAAPAETAHPQAGQAAADPISPTATGQPQAPEPPPVFGCPSCHGGLYEIHEGGTARYRCRVGHVWSPRSLLDEQDGTLEGALWMALRSLQDKSALAHRMAEASRARGNDLTAARYLAKAADADAAGRIIAGLIRGGNGLSETDDAEIPLVGDPEGAE
jgi:two-component system, chemotaxis family, protein-glutamate methylesterase/glutaminase